MICLLWIHNINLHLARSKLQLPGTALVISLNRHSGWPFAHQMCLSTGMPADWASSSGQDFRSPRDMWLVLVQSICIKSPVFQHPKSQKISENLMFQHFCKIVTFQKLPDFDTFQKVQTSGKFKNGTGVPQSSGVV